MINTGNTVDTQIISIREAKFHIWKKCREKLTVTGMGRKYKNICIIKNKTNRLQIGVWVILLTVNATRKCREQTKLLKH